MPDPLPPPSDLDRLVSALGLLTERLGQQLSGNQIQASPILELQEAAAYLKLKEATLCELARENKIPCAKVGRSWRFHRDELDHWIRSGGTQEHGKIIQIKPLPKAKSRVRNRR